jgi:hypothetical protein
VITEYCKSCIKMPGCRRHTFSIDKCSDYQSINIDNACLWTYDENHDYYETECEHAFCIIEGTPKDNDMKYCPYCGKEIKTK